MGKYLKLFETHTEYDAFKQTEDFILPNVSHCIEENHVHYNPLTPPPMNIIRYEASEKLTETTSDKSSGIHTNRFNTTIVSHTFENGVGTIEFEEDVTSINRFAFYGCSNMTSIDIPNSVTSICIDGNTSDGTFQNCTSLTSITIPNSVTTIGACTFMYSGLTSIDIPNNVTTIGGGVFYECRSLTSVTISGGVTSIDSNVLTGCTSLTSVTIEATTPPTLGIQAFNNTNDCPIYVPAESVETYKAASNWSDYASRIQAIPTA